MKSHEPQEQCLPSKKCSEIIFIVEVVMTRQGSQQTKCEVLVYKGIAIKVLHCHQKFESRYNHVS